MNEHPWMSKDLLVRLRWWAFKFCGKGQREDRASDDMSEAADRIEKLEADLEVATMKRLLDSDRIKKLEAALDDALQYVSRADWHYLKDETRKALEENDE